MDKLKVTDLFHPINNQFKISDLKKVADFFVSRFEFFAI